MSRPAKRLTCRANVGPHRLPFGPIAAEFGRHGLHTAPAIARAVGCTPAAIRDWARQGVGIIVADRLCIRAGAHPFVVYGEDWFAIDFDGPGGKRQAFTALEARSVRARHAAGAPMRALAREYGVDKNSIRQIVTGKTYREDSE